VRRSEFAGPARHEEPTTDAKQSLDVWEGDEQELIEKAAAASSLAARRRRGVGAAAPPRGPADLVGARRVGLPRREAVLELLRRKDPGGVGAAEGQADQHSRGRDRQLPGGAGCRWASHGPTPATLIVFRDGLAVTMRQFPRSLRSAGGGEVSAPPSSPRRAAACVRHGDEQMLASILDPAVRWGGEEETPETWPTRAARSWPGTASSEGRRQRHGRGGDRPRRRDRARPGRLPAGEAGRSPRSLPSSSRSQAGRGARGRHTRLPEREEALGFLTGLDAGN